MISPQIETFDPTGLEKLDLASVAALENGLPQIPCRTCDGMVRASVDPNMSFRCPAGLRIVWITLGCPKCGVYDYFPIDEEERPGLFI